MKSCGQIDAVTTMFTAGGKVAVYRQPRAGALGSRDPGCNLSTALRLAISVCFCDLEGSINKCTAPTITSDFS
jgi:hypothetical protein